MAAPPVTPSIVEQFAEDAAFLWLLRDRSAAQPHMTLRDLARLDERVEAHLDGLRVAGKAGWEMCNKILELSDAGEVFALTVVALELGEAAAVAKALKKAAGSKTLARGLI